jgi:hypothetical protein
MVMEDLLIERETNKVITFSFIIHMYINGSENSLITDFDKEI